MSTVLKTYDSMIRMINELDRQNERYLDSITRIINYIETTEDEIHRQLHKIHVVLDSTLENNL